MRFYRSFQGLHGRLRVCKSIALRLQRLFWIGLIVVAVCAPDVLCQPVLVDDLVAALAHGLPEVGAVVLEAVALQHLQAAELALAHQASEVGLGRLFDSSHMTFIDLRRVLQIL